MAPSRILQYDFDQLPSIPFAIYFLDEDGGISNKKYFTVTQKRINEDDEVVEIFVTELKKFIPFNCHHTKRVENFHLN